MSVPWYAGRAGAIIFFFGGRVGGSNKEFADYLKKKLITTFITKTHTLSKHILIPKG